MKNQNEKKLTKELYEFAPVGLVRKKLYRSAFVGPAELLRSDLLSSLKEIRFHDQEFAISTPLFNIKYNHPRF